MTYLLAEQEFKKTFFDILGRKLDMLLRLGQLSINKDHFYGKHMHKMCTKNPFLIFENSEKQPTYAKLFKVRYFEKGLSKNL